MKTFVEMTGNCKYGDYKKGDKGYIDGYMRGADGIPNAVVVIGERVVMCYLIHLKVINQD